MSKRKRTSRSGPSSRRKAPGRRSQAREEEPDLIEQVGAALEDNDPLSLLGLASTLLSVFDTRSRNPFVPTSDGPSREEVLESFMALVMRETSALLTAVAALSGDEVLMRRVSREVASREHVLPAWLTGLPRATAAPDAFEVSHVLGDGDNVIIAARLPSGHVPTTVVYIDHNMGTLVKDAFVVPDPPDEVVERIHAASSDDPDTVVTKLAPAEAKARIRQAIELSVMTYPPLETDTWPACRALVEWMTGLLPDGGVGYERPEWDDEAIADLARRFWASPFAAEVDDPDDLLSSLLWFGTDYGPGDPLRWSPVAVEILLLDWIPRKIVANADILADAPDLLRAFVRFCHHERGIRAVLTAETLAAIDAFEREYQRLIRSERPQGPAALVAAMGLFGDDDDPLREAAEIMLDGLRETVGGDAALEGLDADPLPDEPFAWDAIPPDVHDRVAEVLALVERCCAELLDQQYRTVCRRLLADASAADPDIFRRRGRAETAAAAICWIAGKANSLFDPRSEGPTLMVKQLAEHFGLTSSFSGRSEPLLRAIGVDPYEPGREGLGTPRYLTGLRRAAILADRDRYRAMVN